MTDGVTELVADTTGVRVTSALTEDDADTVDETETDGERVAETDFDSDRDDVRDKLSERDPVDDGETERLADLEHVTDLLGDAVTVSVAEFESVCEGDADTERPDVGDVETVDGGVALTEAELEKERVRDGSREPERLAVVDAERLRLELGVRLGDRLGVRLGVGRQAQQASIVTRQLSSLSAPLAKKLGVSTSAQAPAPEGAGWPAAGVPHSVALLA